MASILAYGHQRKVALHAIPLVIQLQWPGRERIQRLNTGRECFGVRHDGFEVLNADSHSKLFFNCKFLEIQLVNCNGSMQRMLQDLCEASVLKGTSSSPRTSIRRYLLCIACKGYAPTFRTDVELLCTSSKILGESPQHISSNPPSVFRSTLVEKRLHNFHGLVGKLVCLNDSL